jgi:5-methylthioadenosine/S-adenosylhomocysteine deaminase
MNDKIFISGGLLLDPGRSEAEEAELLVENGRISAILPPGYSMPEDAQRIDATARFLIPGLVNAHTHSHLSFAKGIQDRFTLEQHLNAGPWSNMLFSHEERRTATMLAAAEMISKGCTAAYDLHLEIPEPSPEGMQTVADAYADTGMRVLIAPMLADRSVWQAIPGLLEAVAPEAPPGLSSAKDPAALVADLKRLVRGWNRPASKAGLALAPTIPLHCSEALLRGCARISEEEGTQLHMHLAESKVQAVAGKAVYQQSLTAKIAEAGLLSTRFTAAHAVWLDDRDFEILASHGAKIAHNAGSNLRLGSGIAAARSMLDRGLTLGIGTDASSCADGLNMFEAIRTSALVSHVMSADPARWLSSLEVFQMATIGGARLMGLEKEIGRLLPGYAADIVFLDLGHLNYVPLNNPLQQMVFVENGAAVRKVLVDGKTIFSDGVFSGFDISALKRKAHAASASIRQKVAGRKAICDRLAPTLLAACLCMTQQPFMPERRFECT